MAGIGFQLERILEDNTYLSHLKAYMYSAVICSGPWILSVLTITALSVFTPKNIDMFEMMYFRTVITYIFCFSLIVAGILYLSLSRYLADKLYEKDDESIIPIFNSSIALLLIVQAPIGFFLFNAEEVSLLSVLLSVFIYMVISILWVIMIFLTTLRDYSAIFFSYLAGAVISVVTSLVLGGKFGLEGYLAGYFIGHFTTTLLLSSRIFIEFKSKRLFDMELFPFLLKNKTLVFIGLFYNIAIWIDKIVFWMSPMAVKFSFLLRAFPTYEIAVFFAYIGIIPALSIFLIHVETNFYREYKNFYSEILNKASYSAIKEAKKEMMRSLRASASKLIIFQGIITLLLATFSQEIAEFLRLKPVAIPIFRIASIGAFLHSLLLVVVIVSLYFDFQGLAFIITLTFLVTNGIFSFFTLGMEVPFLGYGYFFSTLVSLILGFYLLDYKLKRLEYLAFAPQPLALHREEEIV